MRDHRAELEAIIRADPDLMRILRLLREFALPQGRLVAGAIYQTVWNQLCALPRGTGIKDFDLIYFDEDVSYEAEDAVIRKVAAAAGGFRFPVETRNQARVHLWYGQRFGGHYPKLASADQSLSLYAATAHAVGASLEADDRIDIIAPFGLDDIFDMILRRNPALPASASYGEKARRAKAIWPRLRVVEEAALGALPSPAT
ncbi:hypothetical protein SAMN05444161_2480 [Rhizobiales bacterium GAS191]|jgi:hypothetical protein|nr:hypothetical protein SAMN05519104_0834 [Rhizobiales bacterium GAS188]SED08658.1 hypothetical protein SAMN05444161_2480 [Rhizobiales bacterium GAS191]